MFPAPIVRTYYSLGQYQQDTPVMAAYGYHAVNVDRQSVTNGLALTLILLFGLLLAPFCIGLIILCFLPTAFSTKYVVSYIGQQYMGGYAQSMQPYAGGYPQQPYAGGYQQPQPYPGPYSQPLPQPYPPSYSQPLPQQPPATPQTLPPEPQNLSLSARLQEAFTTIRQFVLDRPPAVRILIITGAIVVLLLVGAGSGFVITALLRH